MTLAVEYRIVKLCSYEEHPGSLQWMDAISGPACDAYQAGKLGWYWFEPGIDKLNGPFKTAKDCAENLIAEYT